MTNDTNQYIISANIRYKARSDTLANWTKHNPILLSGEPGVVIDGSETEKIKFGDGVTPWNELPYWLGPQGPKGEKGDKGDTGEAGPKGEKGEDGKQAIADQVYNPESENAQSGKAVAEALADEMDKFGEVKNQDLILDDNIIAICSNNGTLAFLDNKKSEPMPIFIGEPIEYRHAATKQYIDDFIVATEQHIFEILRENYVSKEQLDTAIGQALEGDY